MHQKVSLQLGVVQELLLTARVCALEELVAMHSHMLLKGGPVRKNLPASFEVTPVDPWDRHTNDLFWAVFSQTFAESGALPTKSLQNECALLPLSSLLVTKSELSAVPTPLI